VLEMTDRISNLTIKDLRRVAHMVVSGLVENKGNGTGAPTVVLQEATPEDGSRVVQLGWEEIQAQIYSWKLGRR